MYSPLVVYSVTGGYRPSQSIGGPDVAPNVLYRGRNYWLRPFGRLVPVRGVLRRSTQSTGPYIFPIGRYRGSIGGSLVSGRLPKSSLVRYNRALFFVSEQTSQQVYLNESTIPIPSMPFTLTGVITSPTSGKLRVALLNGNTYQAHDAGLTAPQALTNVSPISGGTKGMDGIVSIVACRKRINTETISNPSPANTQTLSASVNNRLRVVLPAAADGQDAWLLGGTYWGQGNFGPWRLIREVRVALEGTMSVSTVTVNQSQESLLVGSNTRFLRDLRVGDVISIAGQSYTLTAIASDTTASATLGPEQGAGASATVLEVVLEWRNGELTDLIEFDNDEPPILDGLMLFNNVPFGWQGNVLYPSKIGNPESFPRALARITQTGADIVSAIAGDARIYLMTTNSLEVVTFTQNPADPFLIRQAWSFGFSSPTQAVVAEGTLFAAVGTATGVKVVRTRVDDSPDLEFSAPVEADMANWNVSNVVLAVDPSNAAVLVMHYDGVSTTTVLPYMLQQGVWGLPIPVPGKVTSATTVNNSCELMVAEDNGFKTYEWEGDTGANTAAYVAFPFIDKEGLRQVVKGIKFTGSADTIYVYKAEPGIVVPDVTDTMQALTALRTEGDLMHQNLIFVNIPNAQSFSIRVDSRGNTAVISEITVLGLLNRIQR